MVGWRVSPSLSTDLALAALEQALYARLRGRAEDWVPHSDHGVQYVSVSYPQRLAEVGIEPSVGSVGDSDDNALAESVMGLYKTERMGPRGPWRTLEAVELATLGWVDGFNPGGYWNRSAIDHPLRSKQSMMSKRRPLRPDSNPPVSGKPGAVHCHRMEAAILGIALGAAFYFRSNACDL
jgi:transposase InsO family protein